MKLIPFNDTPFQIQLSFSSVIERLEAIAADPANDGAVKAQLLLTELEPFPEFRNGITDEAQVRENHELISRLLEDYFPPALTNNEIKAINFPYANITFNHTARFNKILEAAGTNFESSIRDFDQHRFFVLSCCIILNEFYGTQLNFATPLFYDIPTADGIIKHYRILYNGDFLDIIPTEKAVPISQEDIDYLMNNYDDLPFWKQKFPQESWLLKGFAIMTLFDATVENAVSIFKEKLLGLNAINFQQNIESIFRSIYQIPDVRIGFSIFNQEEEQLSSIGVGHKMNSFILQNEQHTSAKKSFCTRSYHHLIDLKTYFAVSDTNDIATDDNDGSFIQRFVNQGIRSFIVAPVVKNGILLGMLEVVSGTAKALNSINANKLEVVMPFLTETVERLITEAQNQVRAIIQEKYTTIHPSVYWKFRKAAQEFIDHAEDNETTLSDIVFPDVYPLYGQVDIKGSSEARNLSVQRDLQHQIDALLVIVTSSGFQTTDSEISIPELSALREELSVPVRAATEQSITAYLDTMVHPVLRFIVSQTASSAIDMYLKNAEKGTGDFHIYRRKYEQTITAVNAKMAYLIDKKQKGAQAMYPHYYERFKTDGVEHNLYIGASIAPTRPFDIRKLHGLRLWQLEVLCDMERAHEKLKPTLPYALDVTTLVLVFHSTISIRFKMDEKRFDVDGSYNARFEIVKKRIDKAHIRDTDERITQAGMLTIVYSNDTEATEYKAYIQTLQSRNILAPGIEQFELEELQGVSGLKALRVKVVHEDLQQ